MLDLKKHRQERCLSPKIRSNSNANWDGIDSIPDLKSVSPSHPTILPRLSSDSVFSAFSKMNQRPPVVAPQAMR